MTTQTRPNFLFIMTDQLRSDWLGCAGHPVVKTPHIDALAAVGIRFRNFQATSPVCMPNRASFMTGRYPSTHGLRYNGCLLPLDTNCFTDVLRAIAPDLLPDIGTPAGEITELRANGKLGKLNPG